MMNFLAALGWSVGDAALFGYLVLVMPLQRSWRGPSRPAATGGTRTRRYGKPILRMVVLLAVLAANWIVAGRSPALLGLGQPTSATAMLGLIVAIVGIGVLVAVTLLSKPARGDKREALQTRIDASGMLPRERSEWPAFLAMVVLLGCGWELLYRGFLLWCLGPLVGIASAVAIAALAYGLAHGYTTQRQRLGSVAGAFAFTIAYAATGSLWWLMLIHTALPLLPALIQLNLTRHGAMADQAAR